MLWREPWRILFPLGTALAWLGVLPWLLFSLRLEHAVQPLYGILGYRAFVHPLSELEGFLSCFGLGLLFTLLPRATGSAPPRAVHVATGLLAPLFAVALTAAGRWEAAQVATVLLLLVALEFTLRRVRLTASALWIPFGLLLGAAGTAMAAGAPPDELLLRETARDLVIQGMFPAMAIGAGRLLRNDEPALRAGTVATQLASALAFAASFWVGARFGQHLGFALRALACIAMARPLRPEWDFGPHNLRRGFAHLALWLLAFGNGWAAAALNVRRAGLHVIFVGSFASLLMAALTEARASARLLALTAALLALSVMARAMVELDPASFHLWMGISAASFLLATASCAVLGLRLAPAADQSV